MSFSTFRAIFPPSSRRPFAARSAAEPFAADLATIAVEISDEAEKTNPNIVKVVGTPVGDAVVARALFHPRHRALWRGPLYHHIGLYAWRRAALERFVSLPALDAWRSANRLSSFARSRMACASTWRSLTPFPWVSILPPILSARANPCGRVKALLSERTNPMTYSHQSHRLSGRVWRKFGHGLP
jgi:hypothetical protein